MNETTALFLVGATISFSVVADDEFDVNDISFLPYVGVKAGLLLADDASYQASDPQNTTTGIYAGIQINKQWSWDLGYQHQSQLESDQDVKVDVSLIESAIRYDYYFNEQYRLYGRLGAVYWDIDKSVPRLRPTYSGQGYSPTAEIGMGYNITPNLKLDLGYQYIHALGSEAIKYYDSHAIIAGLSYRFDRDNKIPIVIQAVESQPYISPVNENTDELNKQENTTKVIVLSQQVFSSLFDFDSDQLTESSKPFLVKLVTMLAKHPSVQIDSVGHTDLTGPELYNQRLSEQRAQAVADYLTELGVEASRINVRGEGALMPVSTNATAEGRARNRRVEIIVPEMSSPTNDNKI